MTGSAALKAATAKTIEQHSGTPVTVAGQAIRVGKLSINQWLALTELGVQWASSSTAEERQQLQAAANANGTTGGGTTWSSLRSLLREDVVIGFYSVLVDLPVEHLEATFDIAEFMEVLDAADQHNDLRRVWAAFSRVASRWRPPVAKPSETEAASATPDSPPSSSQP